MTTAFLSFTERWRRALPAGVEPADLDEFIRRNAEELELEFLNLAPVTEQSLRGAVQYAPQFGAVLHCGDLTLGAHPDQQKREAGEVALIDWSQTGGVVIAEGARAPGRLMERCGTLRTLGALGRALLKVERPDQEWMAQFRDVAFEAQRLEDISDAPEDGNLRLGLAMRALAHRRLGQPGPEVDVRMVRPEEVGHPPSLEFRHSDDVAHLRLSHRDRGFLPTKEPARRPSDPSTALQDVASVAKPALPTSFIVLKGCPKEGINIREILPVVEVTELGKEYSRAVRLTVRRRGKLLGFDVRHINRLRDPEFNARRGSCVLRLGPWRAPRLGRQDVTHQQSEADPDMWGSLTGTIDDAIGKALHSETVVEVDRRDDRTRLRVLGDDPSRWAGRTVLGVPWSSGPDGVPTVEVPGWSPDVLAEIKRELPADVFLAYPQGSPGTWEFGRHSPRQEETLPRGAAARVEVPFTTYFGDYKVLYIPGHSDVELILMRWVDGPHPRPTGGLKERSSGGTWDDPASFEAPTAYDIRHGPLTYTPGYMLVRGFHSELRREGRRVYLQEPIQIWPSSIRRRAEGTAALKWLVTEAGYGRLHEEGSFSPALPNDVLRAVEKVLAGDMPMLPLDLERHDTRWLEPIKPMDLKGDPFRRPA